MARGLSCWLSQLCTPSRSSPATLRAPRPCAAARRLLVQQAQQGRRLAQAGDCLSSTHTVVATQANCGVRCRGLLTPQKGEAYTGGWHV